MPCFPIRCLVFTRGRKKVQYNVQVSYYGNPHSRTHQYGWESEKAMEVAREQVNEHLACLKIKSYHRIHQVAGLVGADPKEIIWTSGATESNNIAVKGVGRFYKGKKKHVVTTQTEHKCV